MANFRPDLIQGWMYHGNLAASLAAWLAPWRPAVAWNVRHTLHAIEAERPLTRPVIRANRALSTRADAILYNANRSRRRHEVFGFSAERGRVIPNGFDTIALQSSPEQREAARRLLNLPNDVVVVGHVARFHPMKDHASFLRAAVEVARQVEYARFLIAGREVHLDNPTLSGIVPSALMDRFYFLGERSDVRELMQAMNVLCLSSAWGEAFPNVLGEAMALGIPCVATNVGDSADIVGETGMVVPPADSRVLAQALMKMLEKTAEERRSLGEKARGRIEVNYALPQVVKAYQRLYDGLRPIH